MSTNNIIPPDSLDLTSIAFIDSQVEHADYLLQMLQVDKVFLLDNQSSGIEQITQVLTQYTDLDSVHIFSHGSQGELQLGNSRFSQTNLDDYQNQLERWQTAFSEAGDLLFYGCNLAVAGTTFVDQISQLTQADVAASNDLTGHASLGGDWDLEVVSGSIEATIALSQATQATYQGQLNIVFSDDFESNLGWNTNPNNNDTATTGQWEVANPEATALNGLAQQLGTTVSGSQALVTQAAAGSGLGSFDIDAGITSVRSPDIVLAENADYRLDLSYYLAHLDNANTDDFLRITLVGEQSSQVLLEERGDGSDRAAAWTSFNADISQFAGETIALLVEAQDGGTPSLVEAAIDDLVIRSIPEPAPPTNSNGDGLKAEYFNNQNFTDLQLTRTDTTVDFNWGDGAPDPTIGADTFSVRWTGQIEPRYSETYTFQTTTDDGVRLWVNNQLVIDQFVDQAPTNHTGTITLEAGQKYDIRLDYYENGGGAVAELYWSSSTQAFEIVPQSQLFSTTPDTQAPTATLTANTFNAEGSQSYDFTVTYTDPSGVDSSSLDNADILVTGPNGFSQTATLVSTDEPGDGSPRTATYRIISPNGGWDESDTGAYTVNLVANQVADTLGNSAAATFLGTFDVTVLPPGIVFSDDFESNRGWLTNPNNSDTATTGQWEVANPQATASGGGVVQQLGETVSGSQALVTQAAAGSGVGSFDIDAGITSVRSPDIVLAGNANYSLDLSYYFAHLGNANGDDFLRITLVGEQSSLVLLEERGDGSVRAAAWNSFNADISQFSGQTIALLVEAHDGGTPSLVEAAIDDLVIRANGPLPSTFALQNSETLFVNEAAGIATVTAIRTGAIQEQATVEYTLNELGENSATGDVDFTRPTFDGRPNTGQIVFAPGVAEVSFTIPIVNDSLSEGNETFAIGLQNPNGENTLGAPRTKLITIVDDDTPPTIALAQATLNVAESNGEATVTVQRSGNTDTAASVTYSVNDGTATFGQDYSGTTGGTLNFAVGQTAQTINISILEDILTEGNETFSIMLDSATNASLGEQLTTTVSILDNDLEMGDLTRTTAVTGLVEPTTLDWTPDGRYMLVAERGGVVKVVDNGVLQPTPLIDIADQVNGTRDRGLLGLAIHPEFSSNPYVYLLYTYDPPETAGRTGLGGPDGNGNRPSRLVRVTVNPDTMVADPNSLVILAGSNSTWEYTSSPTGNSTGDNSIAPSGIVNGTTITAPTSEIEAGTQDNDPDRPGIQNLNIRDYLATDSESHSIGDLEFGADGYLYLTNGDGTSYNFVDPRTVRVQDINNLSGKLLRIDPITGEGVATNPFYNGDGDSNQAKVFYSGLRNPFRFAFDPVTNLPVIGDVGWNSFEEVNTGPAGSNFGWPYIEGPNSTGGYSSLDAAIAFYNNGNRNNPGDTAAVLPLLPRSHGAPDNANAIMVGDFYNSNTLMFGDVNNGTLYAATLDDNRQVANVQVFDSGATFVVDMKMGPDGKLYGVNLVSGSILRWEPDTTPPLPPVPDLTASFNDFVDTSSLNLNGSAAATNGSLRLTPATNTQAGSAFINQALQVSDTTSFSTQFQFQISGGQGTNGADGFAFVLQNSGAGANAVGITGGDVGYGGIGNSLAIEFDTYQGPGDPTNNHISLLQNGNTSTALLNTNTDLDLNSGSILTSWIDYDGTTDTLSFYLSNSGVKPIAELFSYVLDLEDILGACSLCRLQCRYGWVN